jgi:hypothetical protein
MKRQHGRAPRRGITDRRELIVSAQDSLHFPQKQSGPTEAR